MTTVTATYTSVFEELDNIVAHLDVIIRLVFFLWTKTKGESAFVLS